MSEQPLTAQEAAAYVADPRNGTDYIVWAASYDINVPDEQTALYEDDTEWYSGELRLVNPEGWGPFTLDFLVHPGPPRPRRPDPYELVAVLVGKSGADEVIGVLENHGFAIIDMFPHEDDCPSRDPGEKHLRAETMCTFCGELVF